MKTGAKNMPAPSQNRPKFGGSSPPKKQKTDSPAGKSKRDHMAVAMAAGLLAPNKDFKHLNNGQLAVCRMKGRCAWCYKGGDENKACWSGQCPRQGNPLPFDWEIAQGTEMYQYRSK
jgi:hypothetical protein